jgi:hypothetical protein
MAFSSRGPSELDGISKSPSPVTSSTRCCISLYLHGRNHPTKIKNDAAKACSRLYEVVVPSLCS